MHNITNILAVSLNIVLSFSPPCKSLFILAQIKGGKLPKFKNFSLITEGCGSGQLFPLKHFKLEMKEPIE